jgi:phenylacetate-coenzyme A ligase PaaK-like adenylate-forming protein
MFDIEDIIKLPPYSLKNDQKNNLYKDGMFTITKKHYENCSKYRNLLDNFNFNIEIGHEVEEYIFLPVRLFKEYELRSINKENVFKTMTSSGTSGQQVSKIFLDRETASNQTKVLTRITSDFLGNKRLPMLIIDSKEVVKNRQLFSARGAGILGFSMLGRDHTYALDDDMNLNIPIVEKFLEKHSGEKIFIFGFTFMIWECFYKALRDKNISLDLSNGTMIHGGGFKKIMDEAVDNNTYKACLKDVCGIDKVYNYYGMVEQTGSIFMECERGRLHTSIFSDIIIRNHKDFSVCGIGEKGLIQLISLLPGSYPGHSILSEDIGELIGEDNCPCGRLGKTFKIHGRVKSAEVRGCSDTYEK